LLTSKKELTIIIGVSLVTSSVIIKLKLAVAVSDSSGIARFNVPGAMPIGMLVGRIVEIFNSSNSAYEGTGVLSVVTGADSIYTELAW